MEKQKSWTREKQREYMKQYRIDNWHRLYPLQKAWKIQNRERTKLLNRAERVRLKYLVLSHYSVKEAPICTKCSFSNIDALCLDHINNNGAQQRRDVFNLRTAAGTTFYRWLKKNNFPSGFQVLCFNCNIIKQLQWVRK